MTRICWWLVDRISLMLEPGERDAVRGDFAESGETGGQALCGLLGLVARRQAGLWKDWRPWLAVAGLVAPLGMLLSLVSRRVADTSAIYIWLYANNWRMADLGNAAFRLDLAHYISVVVTDFLMLSCGSWAIGFALGSLSRRTIRINGTLFCLVLLFGELFRSPQDRHPAHDAVFSLTFYNLIFPLIVQTVLVLLPSFWGIAIATSRYSPHKENNT